MKCAIMQPTYLPWPGYFNLIASVDRFVFLDNVQFERQSWQSRNRILLQGREHLLAVPVERASLDTPIRDIVTSERRGSWRRDHWKTLQAAYAKARHGYELLDLLEPHYGEDAGQVRLADWNQRTIESIARALGLATVFVRASDLDCAGERTQRLIAICESLGVEGYLSPRGSADYLEEDGFARSTNVALAFQSFVPEPYPQYRTTTFLSHLSIVDVIANLGLAGARAYVMETA